MKVRHSWHNNQVIKAAGDDLGFLLSNRSGGYLTLSPAPVSRYQGWYIYLEGKTLKVIENIEILGMPRVTELHNNFWQVERKRGGLEERFILPSYHNSLIYETSQPVTIELTLDIKESYNNSEQNCFYEFYEEGEMVILKYVENKEDHLYVAIKSDIFNYVKIGRWLARFYPYDQKRNSFPYERNVYQALQIKGQRIVFSAAQDKREAVKEASRVYRQRERLKRRECKRFKQSLDYKRLKNQERSLAYLCAQHSLQNLLVSPQGRVGLYAGLPWFFQFWSRDEVIALKALAFKYPKIIKKILWRHLDFIGEDGQIPNQFFCSSYDPNADSVGWLFQRIGELIQQKFFTSREVRNIKKYLEQTILRLLDHHTSEGWAVAESHRTWMDSIARPGYRLEIQALRLNLYQLAYQLTGNLRYDKLEQTLKTQVYQRLWNGEILADGLEPQEMNQIFADFTIRPNIFVAAYIYPELLTESEWIKCFENILPRLWLAWGGLSSIDTGNPFFVSEHTGEDARSYHSGDSWFYLNNLVALVLYRLDKKRFKKYIEQILRASTGEILWQGVVGHHSEVSSAGQLRSEGCWAQAWSSALYLELVEEMFGDGV